MRLAVLSAFIGLSIRLLHGAQRGQSVALLGRTATLSRWTDLYQRLVYQGWDGAA
jgi:hypothetical protein